MIPDETLSSTLLDAPFLDPDGDVVSPLEDFEQGGIDLNDPSEGLRYQRWTAYYDETEETIYVEADNGEPIEVVTDLSGVIEVSLAFDQNMRPQLAWSTATSSFFRWYDTNVAEQVITEYEDAVNLRLGLDDKRPTQSGASDVILSYIRGGNLYFRAQRDRYLTEYLLKEDVPHRLIRVGMNEANRFQWEFEDKNSVRPLIHDYFRNIQREVQEGEELLLPSTTTLGDGSGGSGIKVTSPDGQVTKIIGIDNSGTIEVRDP